MSFEIPIKTFRLLKGSQANDRKSNLRENLCIYRRASLAQQFLSIVTKKIVSLFTI